MRHRFVVLAALVSASPLAAQTPACKTTTSAGKATVTCTFTAPPPVRDTVIVTKTDTVIRVVRDTVIVAATPPAPTPVPAPAPTPTPPSSSVTPLVFEDFSTYTSTANLLANPRGIWATSESKDVNRIVLDTVSYGASKKSMRYDFPNNGVVCWDYGMRPGFLQIPGNQTHIWVEFVVRFSRNFRVDHGASACASEYKLAAMGDWGGTGRWNIPEMQGSRWVVGYPGNDAGYVSSGVVPSTLWDGQPHVFRIEAQLGKSGGGVFKYWVDGKLLVSQSGFTSASSHNGIHWFAPGLNMNQGPSVAGLQLWWHRIAVYTSDPGWK